MEPFLKRTWAQVDLDALDHNIREIRSAIAPSAKLMCVIKADGYGHGAVPLAKESEAAGADWFAVSNLEEAQELREAGIQKPILILGFTPDSDARLLAQMEISQAVLSESHARQLSSYAQEAGTRVRVHIAVDTGMTRIGLSAQNQTQALEAAAAARRIAELPGLLLEGLFTHFAVADEAEAGAASAFLRAYAGTSCREYFADYFSYYVTNYDDTEKAAQMERLTLETFAFFSQMEAGGWQL